MKNAAPPFFATAAAGRLQNAFSTLVASLETENSHSLTSLQEPKVRYVQTHGTRAAVICQSIQDWPNELGTHDTEKGPIVICQLSYRGWLNRHQLLAGFIRKSDGSNQKLEQEQLQKLTKLISHTAPQTN